MGVVGVDVSRDGVITLGVFRVEIIMIMMDFVKFHY